MRTVLLTGAAGFIGYHVARALLERGDRVTGLDNLDPYYDVWLKRDRLAELARFDHFSFIEADVNDPRLADAFSIAPDIVVHFAAQAGVRYSTENPLAYVRTNVSGQTAIFDRVARVDPAIPVVFASSSSVYGGNDKVPFAETDRVDSPVSVYAATKRAGELVAEAFRHTHGIRSAGLRFFTVYGRYGRPDMAPWLFTDAILAGRPIKVFNNGDMERDFTHVSDVTKGVLGAVDLMLGDPSRVAPVYNIGHNSPVKLMDFIRTVETACGRDAILEMHPKPAGDVLRTCADIDLASRDFGYDPSVTLEQGMEDFVGWYRAYRGDR